MFIVLDYNWKGWQVKMEDETRGGNNTRHGIFEKGSRTDWGETGWNPFQIVEAANVKNRKMNISLIWQHFTWSYAEKSRDNLLFPLHKHLASFWYGKSLNTLVVMTEILRDPCLNHKPGVLLKEISIANDNATDNFPETRKIKNSSWHFSTPLTTHTSSRKKKHHSKQPP